MAIVNIDLGGEQVPMISADYFSRDELDWLQCAADRASRDAYANGRAAWLAALAGKLAHLARGPSAT